MRRSLLFAVLLLAFPLNGAAQFIPHVAVFGGYTYVHAKYTGSSTGFSLNGWDASLEVKQFPLVGFVADVSRQYGSPGGFRQNQTMALFGPQLSIPGFRRVIPYAHVMAGFVHGTNEIFAYGPDGFPCTPSSCVPPTVITSVNTGNAFATALGGGLDYKLSGPIWIRVVQVDWLHANLNPDHHTQMRLATGIVFRFGR